MTPIVMKIQAIVPKEKNYPLNRFERFEKEIEYYLKRRAGPHIKGEFEKTVKNWKHYPKFPVQYSEPYGGRRKQIEIKPAGRHKLQWIRVSKGTGPRRIISRRGNMMRFPRNYRPKTTPSGRYGGPGTKYGPMHHQKIVQRHEIAPREFSEKIAEKAEGKVVKDVANLIKKVFR